METWGFLVSFATCHLEIDMSIYMQTFLFTALTLRVPGTLTHPPPVNRHCQLVL